MIKILQKFCHWKINYSVKILKNEDIKKSIDEKNEQLLLKIGLSGRNWCGGR